MSLTERTFSFWVYWAITGLLALSQVTLGVFFLVGESSTQTFYKLGFGDPFRWLLSIAKFIGAVLLIAPVARFLKEWAYFGFALTFSLAILAHSVAVGPVSSFNLAASGACLSALGLSYTLFRTHHTRSKYSSSFHTWSRVLWALAGALGVLLTGAAGLLLYVAGRDGSIIRSFPTQTWTMITVCVAIVAFSTTGLPSLYHVIHRPDTERRSRTVLHCSLVGLLAICMAMLGAAALVVAYTGHPLIETVIRLGIPPYMLIVIGTAKIAGAFGLLLPLPKPMKEWTYLGILATTVAAAWLSAFAGQPIQDILVPLAVLGLCVAVRLTHDF